MKKFTVVFGKSGGWFSGDIAPSKSVHDDNGFYKSKEWKRLKSARTEDEFLDNAAEFTGPNAIILSHRF